MAPERASLALYSHILEAFLRRHAKTLESVVLQNVTFSSMQLPPSIAQSYGSILRTMREELEVLRKAEIRLHRLQCHGACVHVASGQHHELCKTYHVPALRNGKAQFATVTFEAIATQYNIELRDSVWDFGEFVMRKGKV